MLARRFRESYLDGMWRWATIGIAVMIASTSGGCTTRDCTDQYVYPIFRITVADAETGALICDANVTAGGATADAYPAYCWYVAQIQEGVKTVTIAATRSGYDSTSKEVSTSYDEDECGHAIAKRVKLTLQPQ